MSPQLTLILILLTTSVVGLAGYTVERKGRITAELQAEAALANEKATARTWELSHLQLQGELTQCQAQWADVKERASRALELAIAGRLQAEAELKEFQGRWKERSKHCGAMLVEMERACPELAGY